MSPFALSQPRLSGANDGLSTVGDLQLGEDVRDVVAHRLRTQRELLCDGRVWATLGDEVQDLALAVGERREGLGHGRSRACEVREHPFSNRRAEDGFAPANGS